MLLCGLAILWLYGIRTQLGCCIQVVLSSMFFTGCVIVLPISGLSFLHSWWMIPSGYFVAFISTFGMSTPIIGPTLMLFGSLYAIVVRVGIPEDMIRAAKQAACRETFVRWALDEGVSDEKIVSAIENAENRLRRSDRWT
jgi:hypothetical protein